MLKLIRRLFALCVFLVVLFVGWGFYLYATSHHEVSDNRPAARPDIVAPQPPPPPAPTPHPPAPVAETPAVVTPPAVHAEAAPSPKPPVQPVAVVAPIDFATASKRLVAAQAACLKRLRARPDYVEKKATADEDLTKLEALRAAGTLDGRLEASSAYNKAAAAVRDLEASSLSNDAGVRAASKEVSEAQRREQEEADRLEAARLAEIRDEQARADARRREQEEREAHDPVFQAIKHHQLVEGMTYDQAVEALQRRPYSISRSASVLIAVWQVADGDFWSGTFVDGQCIAINHTRV